MKKLIALVLLVGLLVPSSSVRSQTDSAQITLLDGNGKETTSIVDGNTVQLRIDLGATAQAGTKVVFFIPGIATPLADCTVKSGERACTTASFHALGWHWGPDGRATPARAIAALVNGTQAKGGLTVSVAPRPVVMVHGFNTNFHTWDTYLGPQGYLAEIGIHGYAVGDGQVNGVMDTGSLSAPFKRTNSIAQNAVILGDYIKNVQKATGAEQVDLLVHSMGGMISRYYLDRIMTERNVAQLIILGTPMGGSSCAVLPASLGMLLPATLEIQPSYMVNIFNQQIVKRKGVPFYALAGTKLSDAVQSPCTPVPSDIVVTVDSVKAIPMPVQEIPLLHGDLNTAREVFETFVTPLLKTAAGNFESPADPPAGSNPPASEQFSKVYAGHLQPTATTDVVINIDPNVAVANFALYDPTNSLEITVIGASGNQIQLDPVKNGIIRIDDPSTLVNLGYGFEQPRPGKWIVTLKTTTRTPPAGADYAIAAQFAGGAKLEATQNVTIPKLNETVNVTATLSDNGNALAIQTAQAVVRMPDGSGVTHTMTVSGNQAALDVTSTAAGIYGIEINVTGQTADGFALDRAAFLTFEVQPTKAAIATNQIIAVVIVVAILITVIALIRRRRNKTR